MAAGIELTHSEGQYVIHLLWDMRNIYDSIKAHLLIPQLVAGGYPLERQIDAPGKRQILGKADRWSSRGSHLFGDIQTKGQESKPSMQDEL